MVFITSQVRKLKISIILKALEDAQEGYQEAIEWLRTTGGEWADELGLLSPERFRLEIEKVLEQADERSIR